MPYKDLIKYWHEGVLAVEHDDLDLALQKFLSIEHPVSKIWYNIGCIHILKDDLESALEAYNQTLVQDPCLAVGFFQRSYVHFKLERYEEALTDCYLALAQLRINSFIDYKQLGLRHVLFTWEILYNMATVLGRLGKWEDAQKKLSEAIEWLPRDSKTAMLESALHEVQKQVFLQPLRIPEEEIFRPRKQEVEQLISKDFLGKPKVITSVIPNDEYSGFEPLRPQMPGFYEPCKEAMRGRQAGYHRVLVHYYPENSGEMAVKASSILYVLNKDGDWATAIYDGQKILIPTSYLEPITAPKADIKKMNNGIPLPPTKLPPTRPNIKPAGNLSTVLDAPPRPRTDPPELTQLKSVKQLSDVGVTSAEHHATSSHPNEKRLSDGALYPSLMDRSRPFTTAHVIKNMSPTSMPEPLIKEAAPPILQPKMEMVVNVQSSLKTKQDISVTTKDLMSETEPVSGMDELIKLQVRTEFTVDLPVRRGISYTELQHLLREKLKQQGEKMNIQLSYRDSEDKHATTVKGDEDLRRMWEQAEEKKLTLSCKDTDFIGRPILYHMKAVYRYSGERPEDMSFSCNDIIDVLSEVNEEWLEGHCSGSIGIFPKCYAIKLEE